MTRHFLAIVFAALGCGRAAPPPGACGAGDRFLIAAAHEEELDSIGAQLSGARDVHVEGRAYTCGTLADRPVALALLGQGPARATRSAELALADLSPSAVVVVGIAGGIAHQLQVADVAIPARWTRHDQRDADWYGADPAWLAAARAISPALHRCDDAAVCARAPGVEVGGNGVTGARFVADPRIAEDLRERLGADVTDMETAAVAGVAHRGGVAFVAIRAVSDLVRTGDSRDHVERFGELAAGNAASAAVELVRAVTP